jgi:hypothetical protein
VSAKFATYLLWVGVRFFLRLVANVLGLAEVGDFEAPMFKFSTKVQ